jgi:S1-C subfamily serine protease
MVERLQEGPLRIDPKAFAFDLGLRLGAVVALKCRIPDDAFTAEILGTERSGSGVLIADRMVLTIGYLVTEATEIWITFADGRSVAGHVLGYDHETGFGLVQALGRTGEAAMPIGDSDAIETGARVIFAAAGGPEQAVTAEVVSTRDFAGYWEYALDRAFFTAPAHQNWGGAALIDQHGALVGIGSLNLGQEGQSGRVRDLNMSVPIALLKPIFDDLVKHGRPNRPARPWLGLYTTEASGHVIILSAAKRGPAEAARLRRGDVIAAVAGEPVKTLAEYYHKVWALGSAGVEVPLDIVRDGKPASATVRSVDRVSLFRKPQLH